MKDILIKYPLKVLQNELIVMSKDFKAIRKLKKDEIIDLLIKYNYDISKLPPLVETKRGRKPKPKQIIQAPKYPKITDQEKILKKELTGLIKPKTIYNIDNFIDNIDNSNDSLNAKIRNTKDELEFLKEYYDDRKDKRNENRTKETTKNRLDKFLNYQSDRIDKLQKYLDNLIKKIKKN